MVVWLLILITGFLAYNADHSPGYEIAAYYFPNYHTDDPLMKSFTV
jgi:hypothetical protein